MEEVEDLEEVVQEVKLIVVQEREVVVKEGMVVKVVEAVLMEVVAAVKMLVVPEVEGVVCVEWLDVGGELVVVVVVDGVVVEGVGD